VTITRAQCTVETAPGAVSRVYDQTEAALLDSNGVVTGGTLQYALGTDAQTAPSEDAFRTTIPTAKEAGTYYVWYRAAGDQNHTDLAPVCVTVTISEQQPETETPPEPGKTPETEAPAEAGKTPETEAPAEAGKTPETEAPAGTGKTEKAQTGPTEAEKKAAAGIRLNSRFLVSWKTNKLEISWGIVPGADRYEVYAAYCGKSKCKKISTVRKKTSLTVKKIDRRKLNSSKSVKVYVAAYRGKECLGKTITAHVMGPDHKWTNAKKLKSSKGSYRLAAGKKAKLKIKTVKSNSSKKLPGTGHGALLRFASSDKKVATVSKKGVVKAVHAGTCEIWVYAQNGSGIKVKVTVR
jgi:hypothetical protein